MGVSIIIPTFNEAKNIGSLVEQITEILPEAKMIVVDDNSPDGTGKIADDLASKHSIKVIHRAGRLGLATAVVEGFRASKTEIVGVMDADLSHPPTILPKMILPLLSNRADLVIASRKLPGGEIQGWPVHRKIISHGAYVISRTITNVSDPLSGFFLVKKSSIDNINFQTRGYKILLEILRKGSHRIVEIPYTFEARKNSTSKLGPKQCFQFLTDYIRILR